MAFVKKLTVYIIYYNSSFRIYYWLHLGSPNRSEFTNRLITREIFRAIIPFIGKLNIGINNDSCTLNYIIKPLKQAHNLYNTEEIPKHMKCVCEQRKLSAKCDVTGYL